MLRFNQGLDRALSAITAIALTVMMLHIVLHALMRFLFSAPIYGTNEIVAFWYLPIVALLGIPAAQLQNEQITVTLLIERLRTWPASVFKTFACVLGALVSAGFAWFGLEEASEKMAVGSTAGATEIITGPIYFLVPLTFGLMSLLYLLNIIAIWRTGKPEVNLTSELVEHDTSGSSVA